MATPRDASGMKGRRLASRIPVRALSLVPALVGGAVVALIAQAIGAGWIAIVSLGALFTSGAFLWTIDAKRRPGELGQGVFVGVVVSLALLVVQRDADENLRAINDQQQRQLRAADLRREQAQAKQNLRLTLSRERRLRGFSLERMDMADMVLAGKDLTAARLDHAVLDRVDFEHATMRKISATHAQFRATWLEDADLRHARLGNANLDGANLEDADLRHVRAVGANFTDAWMTRADLRGGKFLSASELAPLSPDSASPASLAPARKASFFRAQMRAAALSRLRLIGVDFRDARLRGANLRRARLVAADFRGAVLDKADLRGAVLDRADLRGANLSGATLCETSLDGSRLVGARYSSTTQWPEGADPEGRGADLERAPLDDLFDTGDGRSRYPVC